MNLQIDDLWSPDLHPPRAGLPAGAGFDVLVQVSLSEAGQAGEEMFGFRVCAPSALAETPSGRFVTSTLVLDEFSWELVRRRVEKLLRQCDSASGWSEAIARLRPYLSHSDSDA